MASLDDAFAEPPAMRGGILNYRQTNQALYERYALLKEAQNPHEPSESECGFSPETIQAGKCINRYQELLMNIRALNGRIAAYAAKLEDVDKFAEQYDEMMKSFRPVRTLFFESLPVSAEKPGAEDAAGEAPADAPADPHQTLNELNAGLNAQYDKLLLCKIHLSSFMEKNIRSLSEQRDALEAECSVLRDFISEGVRELKSIQAGAGEVANPCTICFTAAVNSAVVPCGHAFCAECLKTHSDAGSRFQSSKCPTCRGKVESTIKLFL
jgi:hypothetical protein